jgi:hypothetical protein
MSAVQNRFLRFKRYRTDQSLVDARENHATEVLAACLTFSPSLRADFLNFYLGPQYSWTVEEASRFSVTTQEPTANGGWVDLLLQEEERWCLVVEVKVDAPESGSQIAAYRQWLDGRAERKNTFVVSLVRVPDSRFSIQSHGGFARRTWRELYEYYSGRIRDYRGTIEETLIQHLCDYLEAERIVSTWKPTDLPNFGPGMVAKHALNLVFEQVETSLRNSNPSITSKIVFKDGEWPRLEVGLSSWNKIFGETYLNKVHLYYQTKAAWDGEWEGFYCQVTLWDRYHGGDWNWTSKKLPAWLEALQGEGFDGWGERRRGVNELSIQQILTSPPAEPLKRVCMYSKEPKKVELREAEFVRLPDVEVINKLVEICGLHLAVLSRLI